MLNRHLLSRFISLPNERTKLGPFRASATLALPDFVTCYAQIRNGTRGASRHDRLGPGGDVAARQGPTTPDGAVIGDPKRSRASPGITWSLQRSVETIEAAHLVRAEASDDCRVSPVPSSIPDHGEGTVEPTCSRNQQYVWSTPSRSGMRARHPSSCIRVTSSNLRGVPSGLERS